MMGNVSFIGQELGTIQVAMVARIFFFLILLQERRGEGVGDREKSEVKIRKVGRVCTKCL